MQVGQVILGRNFRSPQFGGPEKPRWFICIGHTSRITPPILFYLHSTTRKSRIGPKLFLSKMKYSFFKFDCYFYFNEKSYTCSGEELRNNHNISNVGNLEIDHIVKIYEGIR